MQWQQFAERLGAALFRLMADPEPDATIIISQATEPSAYLQFVVTSGGVYAEVSSARKYLRKELRLPQESVELLRGAGWQKPNATFTSGNWYTEALAEPAAMATLVERCVVALRDVWRVPEPDAMVYRGFNSTTNDDLIVDGLGLRHEPPGDNPEAI